MGHLSYQTLPLCYKSSIFHEALLKPRRDSSTHCNALVQEGICKLHTCIFILADMIQLFL